jgi:hypothetical protein
LRSASDQVHSSISQLEILRWSNANELLFATQRMTYSGGIFVRPLYWYWDGKRAQIIPTPHSIFSEMQRSANGDLAMVTQTSSGPQLSIRTADDVVCHLNQYIKDHGLTVIRPNNSYWDGQRVVLGAVLYLLQPLYDARWIENNLSPHRPHCIITGFFLTTGWFRLEGNSLCGICEGVQLR